MTLNEIEKRIEEKEYELKVLRRRRDILKGVHPFLEEKILLEKNLYKKNYVACHGERRYYKQTHNGLYDIIKWDDFLKGSEQLNILDRKRMIRKRIIKFLKEL